MIRLPSGSREFFRLVNSHGVEYLLIRLDDLKSHKKASGRHRDLDDLENLP